MLSSSSIFPTLIIHELPIRRIVKRMVSLICRTFINSFLTINDTCFTHKGMNDPTIPILFLCCDSKRDNMFSDYMVV